MEITPVFSHGYRRCRSRNTPESSCRFSSLANILVVAHGHPRAAFHAPGACRAAEHASSVQRRKSLFTGKPSSNPEHRFRAAWPGTNPLSSLRASALSKLTIAPASPGRLACRGACGWAGGAGAEAGSGALWPLSGAGLERRLRNEAANAALLVEGTQIKRGNYSPDAQLA